MMIPELHSLFLKYPTAVTDTRNIIPDSIFFALKGEHFNGNRFASEALEKGAAYAVVDEAEYRTDDRIVLVDDVLKTLQQLATFHRRHSNAKVIALTGSNGKTTTKELIREVLSKKYATIATKGNLNNHIGVPLTLLSIAEDTEMAIVEMGANHQREIAFLADIAQPDFGYITNFGKAHLEGFGGVEGVIKGKSELYTHLLEHKKSVFMNADDPIQHEKLGAYIHKFGFSTANEQFYRIDFLGADPYVNLRFEGTTIATHLIGAYNFTNCAAAVLMGKYFNVTPEHIKQALETYVPDNNRSQVLEKNGHHIILDAYNANPTSMRAALEHFRTLSGNTKTIFLGDMFELGDVAQKEHRSLADQVAKMQFDAVYLVGEHFKDTNTDLPTFASFDALKEHLLTHPIAAKSTLLIKGSRGMALERVLDLV